MGTKLNWEGIYPAVLTPFTKDGEIDFDMFAKNTEAQIKAGVHGIILAGTLEKPVLWKQKKNLNFLNLLKPSQTAESRLSLIFRKIQPEAQLIMLKRQKN